MPESRHKYLYERLGDHDFQQLVGALLTIRFPDFVPLPLRQADGGRDGLQASPDKLLVYQVKWSASGSEKNPVGWLDAAVRQEKENIRRLAQGGAREYVLVTNVPSTGKPGTGTFDRLDGKLRQHSEALGIEMKAMWREAINPMVDSAPLETKWAYADMLAGWDLVRYLISEHTETTRDSGIRELVRKVAITQWEEDERVKFSQVELDREHLVDLFVDVTAERLHTPRQARDLASNSIRLGGAAHYLSRSSYPFTLVRGAPGQGKSTLSQYVCQAYRAAFVPFGPTNKPLLDVKDARFPLRFDLGDYAAWRQGVDVFDKAEDGNPKKGKGRPAAQATIECFLAELMTHTSGRLTVTATDVQSLFERVPSLVVLDGLDEVATASARKGIVREIDLFCARGKSYAVAPKVVVTTRPNSGGLAEPSLDIFEVVSLSPLDKALRDQYLRKWCLVHNVRAKDGRTLRTNFREKTREPYIGELAGNPMQLTILLYLLRQHGDATPSQRTELYDAYMGLLLAREANKHPAAVRKHRNDLMEIIPFLGWYIQSRAEERGHSGRMAFDEVTAAMKHFQRTYGKPEKVVDELFEAATDRLWAMTSKEEGTFEFEVLSLREYFAARYLYRYAGEGDPQFDRTAVFRELLRRPYWLNTVRFYGGNAAGTDIYALAAGVRDEIIDNGNSKQVRVGAWSLVADGVFNSRPYEAATVVDILSDHAGAAMLLNALDSKEIAPLPESGHATTAWKRITTAIAQNPDDSGNNTCVRLLRELFGLRREFAEWWAERMAQAMGGATERAWLSIGASWEAASGVELDVTHLSALDGPTAQLLLNTGYTPPPDSDLERDLSRMVLDGQCPSTTSLRSLPALIAVALNPASFYSFGTAAPAGALSSATPDHRAEAIRQLRKRQSPYAEIASSRRFRQGEKGSTFPWANTATVLFEHAGRCWIVSEIAIIGAASPQRNGFPIKPNTAAFGSNCHPATLMSATRENRGNIDWWRQQLAVCNDDLSAAEWALALWAVASGAVIDELLGEWESLIQRLPEGERRALIIAADRLGLSGFLDARNVTALPQTKEVCRLLESRARSNTTPQTGTRGVVQHPAPSALEPLAGIARQAKWLKVDQSATYR